MRAANIQEYYDLNQQTHKITFEILNNKIEITELSIVIMKLQLIFFFDISYLN